MKNLHQKLKSIVLSDENLIRAYLRGILAAEGSVILRKSGIIAHVDFSSKDMETIDFVKTCLNKLEIEYGPYTLNGMKFQINGRKDFEEIKKCNLLTLHPEKQKLLELGLSRFQRYIRKPAEMKKLILNQLTDRPKTYDEISKALNKGRSTIQSHYIPILENEDLIKRIGKRRQAWLFQITGKGLNFTNN